MKGMFGKSTVFILLAQIIYKDQPQNLTLAMQNSEADILFHKEILIIIALLRG